MDTGIVGTLMLVSKIFDGVTDVFFGAMIDKTKSKLGKARPWMLYAQIGVSICLILLFSIPNMGGGRRYRRPEACKNLPDRRGSQGNLHELLRDIFL